MLSLFLKYNTTKTIRRRRERLCTRKAFVRKVEQVLYVMLVTPFFRIGHGFAGGTPFNFFFFFFFTVVRLSPTLATQYQSEGSTFPIDLGG